MNNKHLVLAVLLFTLYSLNCECRSLFFSDYDADRGPAFTRAVRQVITWIKGRGRPFADTVENAPKYIGTHAYV